MHLMYRQMRCWGGMFQIVSLRRGKGGEASGHRMNGGYMAEEIRGTQERVRVRVRRPRTKKTRIDRVKAAILRVVPFHPPYSAMVVVLSIGAIGSVGAAFQFREALFPRQVAIEAPVEATPAARPGLHFLGDSFLSSDGFRDAIAVRFPGRSGSIDGVGGSSLLEQYYRFHGGTVPANAETPSAGQTFLGSREHWEDTLIIVDGGLTDVPALPEVEEIASVVKGPCPQWFYVEPSYSATPGNERGTARYQFQKTNVQSIREKYPAHFIETQAYLRSMNDGSAGDRSDVARGWVPRSLRAPGDPIHLNAKGSGYIADLIAQRVTASENGTAPLPCQRVQGSRELINEALPQAVSESHP
jgi:hypothetical protein